MANPLACNEIILPGCNDYDMDMNRYDVYTIIPCVIIIDMKSYE